MSGNKNETPLTTAELEAKVAGLQEALSAEADSKTKLQATLDEVSKSCTDLAAKNAELLNENEQLKAVNEGLQSELEKLSEKLPAAEKAEEKKAAVLSTETFTYEGSKYGFNYPVMTLEGKRITNDDVLADKELQAKLVAAGSSMLKKA